MVKKSSRDTIKATLKREIQKTAEATGDLVGNKIANKIISVSKKSSTENSKKSENYNVNSETKAPKIDIYLQKKIQQIIGELRLVNYVIMEYQKITNALNQPSKFRTKNFLEINDELRGTYNTNAQIKFKTTILISSVCDYSDDYILAKGNITVNNTAAADAYANNTNRKVIFKNCAPFTNYISEINNTQVDNAKDIDIVMPMYNLIEYSDNYSKTSGSLWQYCKEIPAVNNDGNIVDFNGANATDSFNFKTKITGQTNDDGIINIEIMVPLKYLSNFGELLKCL